MKGRYKKLVALAAAVLFWSSQANAVLIEIDADDALGVSAGDTFFIDIWARDLGTEAITGYDIDVLYDDTNLTVLPDLFSLGPWDAYFGLSLGDEWSFFFEVLNETSLLPGVVDAAQLSFLSDAELLARQGGADFILFSIEFMVGAAVEGSTDFDFSLRYDEFNDVKCTGNRVCAPTAVPEPGTLALLALGLLGMAATRRRQKI